MSESGIALVNEILGLRQCCRTGEKVQSEEGQRPKKKATRALGLLS
jgi:hypothetical protein